MKALRSAVIRCARLELLVEPVGKAPRVELIL